MTKRELLIRWQQTIRRLQLEHELASRYYEKLNWKLGVPVVVLTAIVGASIFGTLQETGLLYIKIITGFLSVSTVILSSLQTFLGFGDRAAGHKTAADRLGELAKEAQEVLVCGLEDEKLREFLTDLRSRWDAVSKEAPTLRKSTIIALTNDQENIDPTAFKALQAAEG